MEGVKWRLLAVSLAIPQVAGLLGSVFTAPNIQTWYADIAKPAFNPPNWIFAPVWTSLFILMGLALYLIVEKGWNVEGIRNATYFFGIQLGLNVLWSFLFFGLRSPIAAFIEILALWAAIFVTMVLFYRIDRRAALLMVPYLLWVSFAAFLNFSIWMLNL